MKKPIVGALLATVILSALTTPGVSAAAPSAQRSVLVIPALDVSASHSPDGSAFFPTGPLPAGTLLVIAEQDGSLPGGLALQALPGGTAQQAAATPPPVECYGGTYLAFLNTWTSVRTASNCVHIGTSTGTATYWFGVMDGTSQVAAGQGLGYYQGYSGTTFGVWAKWYDLGSASDGSSASRTIPWTNVAANPKFKAMGISIFPAVGNWGV